MTIAVNAVYLRPDIGGGASYLRGVVSGLGELGELERFTFYTTPAGAPMLESFGAHVRIVFPSPEPTAARILFEQLILPWRLAAGGHELIWSPGPIAPLPPVGRHAITIHDLLARDMPTALDATRRLYRARFIDWSVRNARTVIAVTEFTATRIRAHWPAARVAVIHHGVDERYRLARLARDIQGVARSRGRFAGGAPYAVVVASDLVHKDVPTAVRACGIVARDRPLHLVLCGHHGPDSERVEAAIRAAPGLTVHRYDRLDADELALLVACAEAVVVPSRYEGFGLPVVEAAAAGTPVVASDIPVLRESGGDGPCFARAGDADSFAAGLREVLEPAARARHVARGLARVEGLTWRAAAERHLEALLD